MCDISFIIISYNSADTIGPCIDSIMSMQSGLSKEIIVIDNNSQDDSASVIREKYPHVKLIGNNKNIGFAAANNQALSLCAGRYLFFINPDARIRSHSIKEFIAYMEKHPEIGLSGCRIINPDNSHQWSVSDHYPGARHTTTELRELSGSIACVLGAGMLAPAGLIKKVGGFDEDFFLYGEDQDLCIRIRKLGHEIGYYDNFTIAHIGGHSERNTDFSVILKRKISAEYLFYKKHYHPDTIRKIARSNLLQARWRILTIKMFLPFTADRRKSVYKLKKYKIVYTTAKQIISRQPTIK